MADQIDNDAFERARRALEAEHAEAERERQGKRLARRLVIAFAGIVVLASVFFVVLPEIGLVLPPIIPLLIFGVIAAGAIVAHGESADTPEPPTDEPIDTEAHDVIARLPQGRDDDR